MRIVGYCRVATKEQAKLQKQIDDILQYAKENGHEVVSIISDCGVSAHQNTVSLNKLLALARNRVIDCVVCTEPNRLSRAPQGHLEWSEALRRYGITIKYLNVEQHINDAAFHMMSYLNSLKKEWR